MKDEERGVGTNAPQMPHRTGGPKKHKGLAEAKPLLNLVGVRGFEPPTPSSRTKCATKLRYTPMSAGREFTESPDPTQDFFALKGKKTAVRSTIQRFTHEFTGMQPGDDIPATGLKATAATRAPVNGVASQPRSRAPASWPHSDASWATAPGSPATAAGRLRCVPD